MQIQDYLEQTKKAAEYSLQELMGKFDFDKAAAVVKACGAETVPSVDELKETARRAIQDALNHGSGIVCHYWPFQVRAFHYDTPEVVAIHLELSPIQEYSIFVDFRAYQLRKARTAKGKKQPRNKKKAG